MLYDRKLRFSRVIPLLIVVHRTDARGIRAMTKASEINDPMMTLWRFLAATCDRVGANLAKSITGAVCAGSWAAAAPFECVLPPLIARSLSR